MQVWSVEDTARAFMTAVYAFHQLREEDVGSAHFTKDEPLAVTIVAAAANLRSHCYGIQEQSEFDAKGMAGNIIHAIATTNAVTAGYIVIEALKVLNGCTPDCRSTFLTGVRTHFGTLQTPAITSKFSMTTTPAHLVNHGDACSCEQAMTESVCPSWWPGWQHLQSCLNLMQALPGAVQALPNTYGKLSFAHKLPEPNPKCLVCGAATMTLYLDLHNFTLKQFVDNVLKKRLSFLHPTITLQNFMYEEGDDLDDEEKEENEEHLPKTLAELPGGGVEHNARLVVTDVAQDMSITVIIQQQVCLKHLIVSLLATPAMAVQASRQRLPK